MGLTARTDQTAALARAAGAPPSAPEAAPPGTPPYRLRLPCPPSARARKPRAPGLLRPSPAKTPTAPARIVTSRMTSRTISSMSLFRGSVRFNRSSHGVLGSDCLLPSPYFANSRCGGSTQTVMAQAGSPFGWGTGWHLANARARSLSRISIRPTWADAEVTVVPRPSRMATIS